MSKLAVAFYLFAGVVLALFATFSYLMTTVNPESRPKGPSTEIGIVTVGILAPENLAPENLAPENTAPENLAPENLAPENTAPENVVPDDNAAGRKFDALEYWVGHPQCEQNSTVEASFTTSAEREQNSINDTELSKRSKERRSINDLWKKSEKGVVIMKIFGDDGKPRVDIVFHPKRGRDIKWKNNIKTKYPKRQNIKRRNSKFIYNSVLNFMPDDTVILENADYSLKQDLESNDKILENKKETEYAKNVMDSIEIDSLTTSKQYQKQSSSIEIRPTAKVSQATVKTQNEMDNSDNTHVAFDSLGLLTDSPKSNDGIGMVSPKSHDDIWADSTQSNDDINIWYQKMTEDSPENITNTLYSTYTRPYADEKGVIDIEVSNITNMVTNIEKHMYGDEEEATVTVPSVNETGADLTTPLSNVYDRENIKTFQNEAIHVSNVNDTTENYAVTNSTTTTSLLVIENGSASTNNTVSKLYSTDITNMVAGIEKSTYGDDDEATVTVPSINETDAYLTTPLSNVYDMENLTTVQYEAIDVSEVLTENDAVTNLTTTTSPLVIENGSASTNNTKVDSTVADVTETSREI